MTRTVAMLLAVMLAACGSASQAGPKTSNPPPKKAPPAAKAEPSDDLVVQEGMTLKFPKLAFKMTMTKAPWKGNVSQDKDGSIQIAFEREDLSSVLLLMPIAAPGVNAQAIADNQHQLAGKDASLTSSAVAAESGGRYAFTIDRTVDGVPHRTYLAVLPHPSVPDAYLVAVGEGLTSTSDAFLTDVRAVLATGAPLD